MPIEVQVGPPQIAIHQGQTVLISEENGQITWPTDKGLYFLDTRVISAWSIYADGEPWVLLNGGAIAYYASRIFLTNGSFLSREGQVPERSLSLIVSREMDGGMHEDLDITNYGTALARFSLEVSLRCDFADTFEVKSHKIVRRGQISTLWDAEKQVAVEHLSQRGLRSRRDGDGASRARSLRQRAPRLRGRSRTRGILALLPYLRPHRRGEDRLGPSRLRRS